MLDSMEAAGIEPNATLHHFTHPQVGYLFQGGADLAASAADAWPCRLPEPPCLPLLQDP